MMQPEVPKVNAVDLPIAVFDSGVGGLTVAAALRRRLPGERLLYLGDTARLPYGTKSPETVVRYALKAAALLAGRGIKMMVVACNTATSHALPALAQALPGIPVLGVVAAGAAQAVRASKSGRIVVAATEGTCRSGAFQSAILSERPEATVAAVPCALLVALAEEGLTEGEIARAVAAMYLEKHFGGSAPGDCLVLGCTHFPLLKGVLAGVAGPETAVIDCAEAVAEEAAKVLARQGLARPDTAQGGLALLATDAPDRFVRLADRLFPGLRDNEEAELVDL